METNFRQRPEYQAWKNAVLARDRGECRHCGETSNLHTHHIKPVKTYPELAFIVGNGVILCGNCHNKVHNIYGTDSIDLQAPAPLDIIFGIEPFIMWDSAWMACVCPKCEATNCVEIANVEDLKASRVKKIFVDLPYPCVSCGTKFIPSKNILNTLSQLIVNPDGTQTVETLYFPCKKCGITHTILCQPGVGVVWSFLPLYNQLYYLSTATVFKCPNCGDEEGYSGIIRYTLYNNAVEWGDVTVNPEEVANFITRKR